MQELGLIVVILALGLSLAWFSREVGRPNRFLNLDNLVGQVGTYTAVYAIMAAGMTCVIITGGIDISVGAIFALSALGVAGALQHMGEGASAWKVWPIALLVGLGIGLACGLLNGLLVTLVRLHPFIVTLGTMGIFRGIANVVTPSKILPTGDDVIPAALTDDVVRHFFFERNGSGGLQLTPTLVMAAVTVVAWFGLQMTIAGRETYAIGGNEEAARFSGINVNLAKLRVYALCGLTAGLAGLLSVGWFGTANAMQGSGYELNVIAAAVVGGASLSGGRGTAIGALLGSLILGLIGNGIVVLRLNQEFSQIIVGGAILLAAAIDRVSEALRVRRLARRG